MRFGVEFGFQSRLEVSPDDDDDSLPATGSPSVPLPGRPIAPSPQVLALASDIAQISF